MDECKGQREMGHNQIRKTLGFLLQVWFLVHTSHACNSDIVLSEVNISLPMYGPWLTCARQMKQSGWHQIVGGNKNQHLARDPYRKTWGDLMREGGATSTEQKGANNNMKKENAELEREEGGKPSHDWG